MTILSKKYVRDKISAYGKEGDKSFECIGLTISKDMLVNQKCYRLAALNSDIKTMNYVKSFIEKNSDLEKYIKDEKLIKIFGVSDRIESENNVCRVSLRLNNKKVDIICESIIGILLKEDLYLKEIAIRLNKIIKKCIRTSKFTVEQVGYGLDEVGDVCETKIYFSLFRFKHSEDIVGRRMSKEQYVSLIENISVLFSIPVDQQRKLHSCVEYNCYSIMLGINSTENKRELKCYFQYYNSENYVIFLEMINKMKMSGKNVENIIKMIEEENLYLKGFALNFDMNDWELTVKPYFYLNTSITDIK